MAAAAVAPTQPDIAYAPDFEKYQARTARRLQDAKLEKSLPPGFPKQLHSDLAWEGEGLAGRYQWTYELSGEQLSEIEDALKHFQCTCRSVSGSLWSNSFML